MEPLSDATPYDPVLLSPARLGIVSVLMTRRSASFADLKALLGLSQGNLGTHLGKLEEAGYATVQKAFVQRRPRTTARITARGRRAFLDHLTRIQRIAEEAGEGG
jgi:DNA-binding MarR family transcriptional regulator